MLLAMLLFAYVHARTGWHTVWILVQEVSAHGISAWTMLTRSLQATLLIGVIILTVSSGPSVPQAYVLTVIPTDLASGFRYKDGRVLPPLLLQRRGAHPDCKRQHLSSMCAH